MNFKRDSARLKAQISAASPDEAYFRISDLGSRVSLGVSLEGLVDGPDDVWGLTISGGIVYELYRRFLVRDLAKYADAALAHAIGDLELALKADRNCGVAAAFLAGTCTNTGPEDAAAAAELVLATPNMPAAGYSNILYFRLGKWDPGNSALWQAASDLADLAPPATWALRARVHDAQHLFHRYFDKESGAQSRADHYFSGANLADLKAISARILASPHPTDEYNTRLADAWMAKVLMAAFLPALAKKHLARLGRHADPDVWFKEWGRPRTVLAWTRLQAGLWP